ncbi:hypothetical protein RHGRI_038195 [Rhododendron griersonianum]|uniref:Uncharacterized protein n=1 Tax=Rhododendron griersonianum TaxID=479676 RepID=A0AAV6I0K5_9ERIC|nr:hypothetical protein RHGRI_038195 [Rhododendron griersonianum]
MCKRNRTLISEWESRWEVQVRIRSRVRAWLKLAEPVEARGNSPRQTNCMWVWVTEFLVGAGGGGGVVWDGGGDLVIGVEVSNGGKRWWLQRRWAFS